MKHIDTVCEYITHLDTRLASPKAHITSDSPEELNDPIFATSIGLVIYGVRCEEEKNLIHVPVEKDESGSNVQGSAQAEPVGTPVREQPEPGSDDAGEASAVKKKSEKKKAGGFQGMGRWRDWVVKIFDDDVQ